MKKNNFIVTSVTTREKLIRQLILNKPDIIFLDVLVNGEDGRKICLELKQNKEFKNLPVILTSLEGDQLKEYRQYLADEYLQKPFDVLTIIDKTKLLLNISEN